MKRLLIFLFLISVLIVSIVYNRRVSHTPPAFRSSETDHTNNSVPVTVIYARTGSVRQTLNLVGTLTPERQAVVSARVPGRLIAITVSEGQHVKRGQALARIDVGDAKAQIDGASAGLYAARAQQSKARDGLKARQVEMDAQVSQAKGGVSVVLARLKQAELSVTLSGSSARSDTRRAQAAVKQAEAGLKQAESGNAAAQDAVKRMKLLYAHGGVASMDLTAAETQADIANSQVDAARAALEQTLAAEIPARESEPLRTQVSEMDVSAAKAGVTQAQNALLSAYRARIEALRLASRDIEAANALVDQAAAALHGVKAQIGTGTIVSPLDGVVNGISVQAGEIAQPGYTLMTVTAPGSLILQAAVASRYAAQLLPGQSADIIADTQPNHPFRGTVRQVLPVAAGDSHTATVRIGFDAGSLHLLPGTAAKAQVELAHKPNALILPLEAIHNEGNSSYVYTVLNGRAIRKDIVSGASEGQNITVLSGLRPDEQVILSAPITLYNGEKVQIVLN